MIDPNKLYTAKEIATIIGCDPQIIHNWMRARQLRIGVVAKFYGHHQYYGRDIIKCMSHRRDFKPFLKENGIEVPAEEEYLDDKIKDAEKQLRVLEKQFEAKKKSLQMTKNKIADMKKKIRELKNQ